LKSLRVSGYLAAFICTLVLVSGVLHSPGDGPIPVLAAIGLLSGSAVAGVLLLRRKREVDRLVLVWLSLVVIAGVQLLGGNSGPAYPVYFLLLTWMAIPSINGPVMEAGCAIGLVSIIQIILDRSGLLHSSFSAENLFGSLIPALGALLAPAMFGIAVEWLADRNPFGDASSSKKETAAPVPTLPETFGFPAETARSLLPLLHRRSGAEASLLFVVHDENSFVLVDYLGGGGMIADRSLVPSSHWLFRRVSESWDTAVEETVGKDRNPGDPLPYYLDPPETAHVLAFPLRDGETLRAVYVLDSTKSPFPPDVIEDLRDAAGILTTAARDSAGDPLSASPEGSWFSSLLIQTYDAAELKQIIHVVAKHLSQLVEGATVTIAVLDEKEENIQVFESLGRFSGRRSGRRFPVDSGVAGWVINYRELAKRNRMRMGDKAVRTFSETDDPEREVGSCCAVPLMANSRVLGVLILEREEDDGFGRDHMYLLEGVSGLLSLAVERLLLDFTRRDKESRDSLTGLPMIAEFNEKLLETVRDVRRYGRSVAVLEVDIDRFGDFNLEQGYRMGDLVLKACSRRLESTLGSGASIARVGGDSFGVCLPDADRIAAEAVAEKIAASFSNRPLDVDGSPVSVTVSIGGCCSHTDRKIVRLPLEASRSLERAKQDGTGKCRIIELGAFTLE